MCPGLKLLVSLARAVSLTGCCSNPSQQIIRPLERFEAAKKGVNSNNDAGYEDLKMSMSIWYASEHETNI